MGVATAGYYGWWWKKYGRSGGKEVGKTGIEGAARKELKEREELVGDAAVALAGEVKKLAGEAKGWQAGKEVVEAKFRELLGRERYGKLREAGFGERITLLIVRELENGKGDYNQGTVESWWRS